MKSKLSGSLGAFNGEIREYLFKKCVEDENKNH